MSTLSDLEIFGGGAHALQNLRPRMAAIFFWTSLTGPGGTWPHLTPPRFATVQHSTISTSDKQHLVLQNGNIWI